MLNIYPSFRQRVKFYVTDTPDGHPVILGNTWLIANKVILNHASRTMETTTPKLHILLPGGQVYNCWGGQTACQTGYLKLDSSKRLIHSGCAS